MKHLLLFCLAVGCLGNALWAEPEKEEVLRRDVSFLLWEEIQGELWARSKGEFVTIRNLSPYRRSVVLEYEGPPELVLYRKAPAAVPAEGAAPPKEEPAYLPVGRVSIPPELKMPLVILVPGKNGALTGTAFEDHPLDFPMGTYKVFNMSRREIAVGLDEALFSLAPGRSRIVDPGKKENTVLEFRLLYREDGGEPVFAQKTVFRYRVRRREILFIKDHPDYPDRFMTHMVMEYLP